MRITILFFVLALLSFFGMRLLVTPNYGSDIRERFMERLNHIPSQKPELLSKDTLARWLADPENSRDRDGYVFPVMFPFDIIFLIVSGCFLGFASVALAGHITFLSRIPVWIWWALPALYMAIDLAEDSAIAAIFKSVIPLTETTFWVLSRITALKLQMVTAAIGQVGFLGVLNALLYFFPAGRGA